MLVPCRNCGKEVGEKAEICLGCGTETPNRERKFRSNLANVYLFIAVMTLFFFGDVFLNGSTFLGILGLIYLIAFIGSGLWFYFKDLKDIFK